MPFNAMNENQSGVQHIAKDSICAYDGQASFSVIEADWNIN